MEAGRPVTGAREVTMPQDKATMPTDELVEKLRTQARRMSDVSRQMAEAKSLRQGDNPERRTERYMWAKPEDRLEWQAADTIEALTNAVKAETERCAAIADKIATEFGERWMTLNDGKPERERDYQNGRIAGYSDGAALVATAIRQQEAPDEQG